MNGLLWWCTELNNAWKVCDWMPDELDTKRKEKQAVTLALSFMSFFGSATWSMMAWNGAYVCVCVGN